MSTFKNQFQYLFAAFLPVHASVDVWASHFSFMRFRKGSSHAICSECVKHKMIIQGLGHHLVARKMQMSLLYSHLSAQFQDRCTGESEGFLELIDVVIISDGSSQVCFTAPPHHEGETIWFVEPSTVARGRGPCAWLVLDFFVSEGNLCRDSNTSIEILASTLTDLQKARCDLSNARVTFQADNTCREVKTGILMRWASTLVPDHRVKEACLSFLSHGTLARRHWPN